MDHGDSARTAEEDAARPDREMSYIWRRLLVPFASLEDRNFRLLWLGQLGQATAMWAEQMARSWLTWQFTGPATSIGLVNLFRAIPLITLGLVGGAIADRFDKRKILIVIQLWSLAIYVVMAVLILGGWITLWHVYLTAFLLGMEYGHEPARANVADSTAAGRPYPRQRLVAQLHRRQRD